VLGRAPVRMEHKLYGASARDLLARLRRLPDDVGSVLVIGHNPGMHKLALELAGPAPELAGIPHGGAGHPRVPRTDMGRAGARGNRAGRAHPAARSVMRTAPSQELDRLAPGRGTPEAHPGAKLGQITELVHTRSAIPPVWPRCGRFRPQSACAVTTQGDRRPERSRFHLRDARASHSRRALSSGSTATWLVGRDQAPLASDRPPRAAGPGLRVRRVPPTVPV
jgi:hypothetical protein